MKVKIMTSYIQSYGGMGASLPTESYSLVVENEVIDRPIDVAKTYLKLRKKLNKGLKEEV